MADSSASADNVQYGIYLGTWTNYSRGRILGATLTLESRYGLLLLSFTATFVGFVASRFWQLITLMLHRVYSTPEPRDALHHQRQAVLRNSSSAASTLWTSLQLAWCWQAIANGSLSRTLPIIISAAAAFSAFTIAGGFTSWISSGIGDDVLIDGSRCAVYTKAASTSDALAVIIPWVSQGMNDAANYAQQCYSFNTTGTLDCTTFVRSRLQFSSIANASCPFSGNMCRSNNSNLLLDSGLISTDDLGINMPSSQRMFHRQVVHCAPLRTDGFASNVSAKHTNLTTYSYGGSSRFNWTYGAENLDAKYGRQHDNPQWTNTKGFNLISLAARTVNGTVWVEQSDFDPIPQLTLSNADLVIAFLSPEGVFFLNQTSDPWYRSIVPDKAYSFQGSRYTLYRPDEAASPMGCALRYQFCNSSKKCGSLASITDAMLSASTHFNSDPEEILRPGHGSDATASRFEMFGATASSKGTLYDVLNTLGPSSLLSSQHLADGLMGPLPDNQWQLDVSHWFAINLAALQAAFVNAARGPTDEALLPYFDRADDEYQWAMCKNQKILSTGYASLSLFGLYFTYMTGFVIILTSYIAEPILALFYSRRKYKEYKYLEWAANSTLQLQRLAYQGLGSEKWSNFTDDIPKTRPGYFLADLARAYPPEVGDDEIKGMKPTIHVTMSTTTPSLTETYTNGRLSEQSQGDLSRPISAVSELVPQAVSPQAISPISQHLEG